jgi:hypothetical protein
MTVELLKFNKKIEPKPNSIIILILVRWGKKNEIAILY